MLFRFVVAVAVAGSLAVTNRRTKRVRRKYIRARRADVSYRAANFSRVFRLADASVYDDFDSFVAQTLQALASRHANPLRTLDVVDHLLNTCPTIVVRYNAQRALPAAQANGLLDQQFLPVKPVPPSAVSECIDTLAA